jgi:hypothetical protein
MQVRRKTSPLVALAAAYAVVLQSTLLAIGGPWFGSPAFASASLCTTLKGASGDPAAPAGHATGCLAACLACCCGTADTPTLSATNSYRPVQSHSTGAKMAAAALLPVGSIRAHRSRAPPPC